VHILNYYLYKIVISCKLYDWQTAEFIVLAINFEKQNAAPTKQKYEIIFLKNLC